MPVVNPEKLVGLQRAPDNVRNICILAHVDHGKTSLSDSLIATNGIISPKLAGKIRYLDSRPDEQIRGITMESSAISLFFSLLRKSAPDAAPEQQDYLINLIDSPGHVDFSSEVSTASRLCDGAVVLVDAVEGVCSQTVAVLRQSWIEHIKPILVINKMDRLVTELKMSPGEAYIHLRNLLEQVNAVMGSFYQGERMEDDLNWRESLEARVNDSGKTQDGTGKGDLNAEGDAVTEEANIPTNGSAGYEEKGDEDIYFEPERGNVVFSSAVDGWAFTTRQFAGIYEKKLGIKRSLLEKVLWGEFYLDPKTKRILAAKHLKGRNLKPMFVQLVLETIWAVYEGTTGGDKGMGDPGMVEKITKALSINLPAYIMRSRDPRAILTALFAAWIPLSTALLVTVIEHLPSPKAAQQARVAQLLEASPGSQNIDPILKDAMISLKKERTDPIVAFVSKMVSIPEKELPENKTKTGSSLTADEAREMARKKRTEIARAQAATNGSSPDLAELRTALQSSAIGAGPDETPEQDDQEKAEPERLIGFARLFSGTLEVGDEIYVLHPKFSPANPYAAPEPQKVTVTALYLLMGRGLEALTSVPAGVVFGIGGLEGHIMKSGTLCSQLEGSVNLAGLSMGSEPIVRVALEPENPADLEKMLMGLKLLQQSDPCASYEILPNGEYVLLTAGELHLERCLKDLKERFAHCEVQAGAPIVPYRESIVSAAEMNPPKEKDMPRGTTIGVVASKQVSIRLRVRPLPAPVTDYLNKSAAAIQGLYADEGNDAQHSAETDEVDENADSSGIDNVGLRVEEAQKSLQTLQQGLREAFDEAMKENKAERDVWKSIVEKIVAFGPHRNGSNLLIDATHERAFHHVSMEALLDIENDGDAKKSNDDVLRAQDFSDKISYAFQMATYQGPMCQEPMQGVAVFIEEVNLLIPAEESGNARDKLPRLTSEVIKTTREAIHRAFLDWSPRLLLAMYSCEIQASTEVLGKVYAVINQRRGRIVSESMNEGTPFFTIVAVLPVAESFGFSDDIRKRTSGAASPQLIFQGYEMLDEDPFWVPFTEDELEDLGELADKENVAKRYMDAVRRRKGLFVQGKKLVESAEKQKTLKR